MSKSGSKENVESETEECGTNQTEKVAKNDEVVCMNNVLSQQVTNPENSPANRDIKYTPWDVLCVLISLFTYTFDQVSDIFIAVYYFNLEKYWYFGLTLAFIIIPSITMTVFSLTWYVQDYKDGNRPPGSRLQWVIRAICLFLYCGPILRYFESLCYGCQLIRKRAEKKEKYFYIMIYEDTDASLLRLFECFMESAPQLVLQIYILVENDIPAADTTIKIILQVASILSSLVSLSWAIASYNRSLRLSLDEKMKLTWISTIFQFVWRFFNITSRVLSLALFASAFHLWIFLACLIHWILMTAWITFQKTNFCKRRWEEIFFDMVMGAVYIFCFINVKDEPTRYKSGAYHLLLLLEGSAFMLSWFLTVTPTVWYHIPALLGFYATYCIGILLMIVYYFYMHPKTSYRQQVSVNGDMPDGVFSSETIKDHALHCQKGKKLSRRPRTVSSSAEEKGELNKS